ncbi:CST, telomere maintenance, complex subunit CTC1-domain-containing protein [Powellomyces hirtus]|nr:CST, telomere maintenance, complex subunit CTC1-domain-containing protein [Powellomyces hirtus]
MPEQAGLAPTFRIFRIAELLLTQTPTFSSHRFSDDVATDLCRPRNPHPLLVGRFLTKRQAEAAYPDAGLSRISAAICFCDTTGAVPCEFSSFDFTWLGRLCCVREWNFVPVYWLKPNAARIPGASHPSVVADGAEKAFTCLEVPGEPFFLPAAHFLTKSWTYEFSRSECDIDAEMVAAASSSKASDADVQAVVAKYEAAIDDPGLYTAGEGATRRINFPEVAKTKHITLSATVRSKSTLSFPDKQTCFFVELNCIVDCQQQHDVEAVGGRRKLADDFTVLTVFVLYRGINVEKAKNGKTSSPQDILPYYESIHVGRRYLFVDLKASQIKVPQPHGKSEKRKLLLFSLETSKLLALGNKTSSVKREPGIGPPGTSSESHPTFEQETSPLEAPIKTETKDKTSVVSPPAVSPAQIRPSFFLSYTGRITNVVDMMIGIYELDHHNLLYLTFHYLPGLGRGLRIGAEIELHGVHLLANDFAIPRRYQEDEVEVSPRQMVLVACPRSTLRIRNFSRNNGPCYLCRNHDRKQVLDLLRAVNIPDLLVVFKFRAYLHGIEAYAVEAAGGNNDAISALRNWDIGGVTSALRHFGYTPLNPDLHAILLNHDTSCQLATWRYPVPDVVCIADLVRRIEKTQRANGDAGAETSSNPARRGRVPPSWSHRVLSQRDLSINGAVLIGWLVSDSNDMYFRDGSGYMHTVSDVALGDSPSTYFGRLLALKSFEVVHERLAAGKIDFSLDVANNVMTKSVLRWTTRNAILLGDPIPLPIRPEIPPSIHAAVGSKRMFLLQHVCSRTAKLTALNQFCTFRILEGVSWVLNGNRLEWECRPTLMEVPCDSNGGPTESLVLWELDNCYELRNAVTIAAPHEQAPAGSERTLFLKFMEHTSVKPFGNIRTGFESVGADADNNDAPTMNHRASLQLPQPDIDRIKLQLDHGSRTYRTVGAIVSRHTDTGDSFETFRDYLACVEGVLEYREFRDAEPDQLLHRQDATATTAAAQPTPQLLFATHTIGTGRNDRILLLRLRDRDHESVRETMDVYLDIRMHGYPAGLVPGSIVRFGRLAIQMSKRGVIYAQFYPESSITVFHDPHAISTNTSSHDYLSSISSQQAPVKMATFLKTSHQNYYRGLPVKCNITFVQEIALWTQCLACLCKGVINNQCQNSCSSAHHVVQGSARAFAHDGTAEASLYLDDADSVFAMLAAGGCSTSAIDALKNLVCTLGNLNFNQTPPWFTDDSAGAAGGALRTADPEGGCYEPPRQQPAPPTPDLLETCVKALDLRHPVLIRCRRTTSTSNNNSVPEEFRKRTFKTTDGKVLPTIAHQRLNLKVLHLQALDVRHEAARLVAWFAARAVNAN